jgi:murein DD-endopeptidase MepM/ murein hydrolase activator NlpD
VAEAPAASASSGGTSPGGGGSSPSGTGGTQPSGTGSSTPSRPRPSEPRPHAPTLSFLSLAGTRLYAFGAPVRVSFQIDSHVRTIPVTLRVLSAGRLVKAIPLGTLPTGAIQTYALGPDLVYPEGPLELRISAKGLRRGPHVSAASQIEFRGHQFPLGGPFTYGDPFGVTRPGHKHQGQDLLAPQGTPIVAPRGGTITQVAYQPGGAGYYVVLSGAGGDFDYAFMHMVQGSVRVRVGQPVITGQRLGDVGSTGHSSGPHLHFEVWQGAWQAGGHPVDPLPYLKSWR